MAAFLVLEPPKSQESRPDERRERFIQDGFAPLAFVVPLLWFLWHRMWFEAAAVLVLMGLFTQLSSIDGVSAVVPALSLLTSLLLGLEARNLHAWTLRRRGWREVAIVDAHDREEAEIRYFMEEQPFVPPAPDRAAVSAPMPWSPRAQRPALGFVSYPGRR